MQLTLLESHRSFFQVAECALVSVLAHAGLVWLAVGATAGGTRIPTDEREARVFFLLPPDRVDVRSRQVESIQWGRLGQDLENGRLVVTLGESRPMRTLARGARGSQDRSGARGQLPFGPTSPFGVWASALAHNSTNDFDRYFAFAALFSMMNAPPESPLPLAARV